MSIVPDLKRPDKYILGVAFAIPLAAAALFWNVESIEMLFLVDNLSQYFALVAFLVSAVFIYLVHHLYGGNVGRALEVMGIGLIVSAIWAPYVTWHILGAETEPVLFGPAWLGIPPTWWGTFFHTLIAAGYGIVAYGFYLFWTTAEE